MLADDNILELAKATLSNEAYARAEHLAKQFVGTKSECRRAREELKSMVRPPPKRPLYYLSHEIGFLPRWTRNSLRYLGDFIDVMVKEAVYGETMQQAVFRKPLGPAIDQFWRCFPQEPELVGWLRSYNKWLYASSKHDMKLPAGRSEHRFTSREVVLCVFVTMAIANRIATISSPAANYRRGE